MAKMWTTKELTYIKNSSLLDTTNQVVNISQLAKHLNRSNNSVSKKICDLRRMGEMPAVNKTLQIDSKGRGYTEEEKKQIINMYKRGSRIKEIAERFERSESSIENFLERLRKKGLVKPRRTNWTIDQEEWLIENIEFDENGYTTNVSDLAKYLKRTPTNVSAKIGKLRKEDRIATKPDKSKTNVKSKEAHQRFNDARFAHLGRSEKKMMSTTENVQNSKVIQVIQTIIVDQEGNKTYQFYSFDGDLIVEKKTN